MIRQTIVLLLALTLFAGCEKNGEPESPRITLSQEMAVLRCEAGSAATIYVEADLPWTLSSHGDGYDITPTSGQTGRTTVTITASDENVGKSRLRLGSVTFRLNAGEASEPILQALEIVQSPATASQTMLFYMPGWTLSKYFKANIDGIKAAITARIPGDGRILVCYQPSNYVDKAELREISYNAEKQVCEMIVLKSYPEFRTDNPLMVAGMFADVAKLAPAQRYGLMIGCHGKAWVPAANGILEAASIRPQQQDDPWVKVPGALETRSFGDPARELDIKQLAEAMKAQIYRFDYLIFDACFMANIETLYDLRDATDSIVASPCEIMGAGFPYKRAIPYLFTDDGASHDLQQVCWQFWNFYQNDWESVPNNAQSGCISLAVTSELDAMADIMRTINTLPKLPYNAELQSYEGMPRHIFYDLGHYVSLTCPDAGLIADFNKQLDKTFPRACRLNTEKFFSVYNYDLNPVNYYSGVSLSEPSEKYTVENQLTGWYRATH